jgi:hypothetical protein
LIAHARVPLLMFVDSELKISCDVSVDNGTALYKSRVLRWITDMDPRCRRLIFLVRILYIISVPLMFLHRQEFGFVIKLFTMHLKHNSLCVDTYDIQRKLRQVFIISYNMAIFHKCVKHHALIPSIFTISICFYLVQLMY